MTEDEALRAEAARQTAVLRLLSVDSANALAAHAANGSGHADPRFATGLALDDAGLRAYQGHARALARRLLADAYPTIAAMVGEETLGQLAGRLWRQSPPACGDLGEWGGSLPDMLTSQAELKAWPWLADSARLDWACHACGRAADMEVDAASLGRLGGEAPEDLTLVLKPAVRLLHSAWPVAALRQAHELPVAEQADAAARALAGTAQAEDAASSLAPQGNSGGETVAVWRSATDGQARIRPLPPDWGRWMRMLADDGPGKDGSGGSGQTGGERPHLSSLLNRMAGSGGDFDFTAWLTEALREGWLWRVELTCRSGGS